MHYGSGVLIHFFKVGDALKLVDASKTKINEKFMMTVGGIVLGCLRGLCCKFGSYKATLAWNPYVYKFLFLLAS